MADAGRITPSGASQSPATRPVVPDAGNAEFQDSTKLARLRAMAEGEMRRRVPDDGGHRAKRHKAEGSSQADAAGGRFDYGAIKELATGISGFILTCNLQRENSARKEAGPLLGRYRQQCGGVESGSPSHDAEAGGDAGAGAAPSGLTAVKVACRGVVAMKLGAHGDASSGSGDGAAQARLVLDMAAALLADIDGGRQPRLQHVQRIIPVQTTCRLERAALEAAGGRLADLVAARAGGRGEQQSLSFGIAVKHRPLPAPAGTKLDSGRGGAAAEAAAARAAAQAAGDSSAPVDRGAIIASLASGFEAGLRQQHGLQAAVDLKAPDWVLVVEVLPIASPSAMYAALCALPKALCTLKPKLHVRAVGKSAETV